MSEEAVQNLKEDIHDIKSTLKWGLVLLSSILLAVIGVISGNTIRSVENKKDIERYEVVVREMVTKQQMTRLIEFSKIRKEIIKATLSEHSDEEIEMLWKRLEDLEKMVIEDDYGFYLRGAYEDDYKERVKNGYE